LFFVFCFIGENAFEKAPSPYPFRKTFGLGIREYFKWNYTYLSSSKPLTMKNVEESDFKPTYIKENVKQVYDEMKK